MKQMVVRHALSIPQLLAAHDVNPYASPAAAQSVEPWQAAGIGVWRHGSLLVVHEHAALPKDVCIKSGRPATHVCEVRARWTHWARWPREYLRLEVGVSRSWAFWLGRGRKSVFIGMLVLLGCFALTTLGVIVMPAWRKDEATLMTAPFLGLAGVGLIWWFALGHPLLVIRRRRRYYWLSGVNRRYLASLPDWPYGT